MWTSENRFHTFRCKYSKLLVHFQIKRRKFRNMVCISHWLLMVFAIVRSLHALRLVEMTAGRCLIEMTVGRMLSRDVWRVFVMSSIVETSRSSNATAPWQDAPQARKATTLRVKRTVHNSFQEQHLFFVQQGVPHVETEWPHQNLHLGHILSSAWAFP